jgi:predicted DNA-binding transcriptional regulator AlpA
MSVSCPNLKSRYGPYRGLRRLQAAVYVGVSPTKFDQMVADKRMPPPKSIDGCAIWDLWEVDLVLTGQHDARNPWRPSP